ncbi:MAG: DUF11 domain-containing protein, partial [Acidobacteria bacterium]|nr:DUF11 domain-containing protein [Acidobacteriota bacterium]
ELLEVRDEGEPDNFVLVIDEINHDPEPANNATTQSTTIAESTIIEELADLSVTLSDSPDPVTVGSDLTYLITMTNNGPSQATGVVLTDTLPAGVSFLSAAPSQGTCSQSGGILGCAMGNLAADSSATVTIVVSVGSTSSTTLSNTAAVTGNESDPDLSNNVIIASTKTADYLVFPASLDLQSGSSTPSALANTFVGIAIVNPNQTVNEIVLTGVDAEGQETANEVFQLSIGANGQSVLTTAEMASLENGVTSVLAEGSQGPIEGMFLVGDQKMKKLDGVGGQLAEARELYFSISQEESQTTTVLFIHNPDGQDVANVLLKAFDEQGELFKEVTLQIAAQGTALGALPDLFGEGLVLSQGFVEVTANVAVRGFKFDADADAFSALGGQIGAHTSRLLVPHFFVDTFGGTTKIQLLNLETEPVTVRLEALDSSAHSLGVTQIQLDSHKLFVGDVGELLNFNASPLNPGVLTGYLDLRMTPAGEVSEAPARVMGSVSFIGNEGKFRSTLPMVAEGRQKVLFPQVAQSNSLRLFTGLAILNGEAERAQVTVRAFDQQGTLTAEAQFDLAAGQQIVDLLNGATFFGAGFQQINGHLQVTSTVPVVSIVLLGDYNSDFLASIEPQSQD